MSRSIFPSKIYDSERNKVARDRLQVFSDGNMSQNTLFQTEAHTDALLEAGDQRALNNLGFNRVLPQMDMYTTNKIKRMVSMVSGAQRRGRKSSKIIPQEQGDQETADQFTKLIFNINNNCGGLEVISDSFQSSLTTGLTLTQLWIDYRDDVISGDIRLDVCPYNTFMIDPNFTKADLSDCNVVWKRSYLTAQVVKSLLPEHSEEIDRLSAQGVTSDDLFPYLQSTDWKSGDFLSYDEFYYRDYRIQKKLIDTATGEVQEYRGQDDEILPLFLKKNPTVKLEEIEIPTVRLSILVNGTVFYDGLNPIGIDTFPFVAVFAYKSQQVTDMYLKFQGLARGMRDNQFLFNLMTSLEVEYVQSRVNSGVKYKPTSVVDPKVVERRDLSGNIPIKKNASMDDVQFITPGDIPASLPVIREQAGKELIENEGGNEELAGLATGDVSGLLAMQRQNSGMMVLEPLMDSLDRSQRLIARMLVDAIQVNYTPGKVQRIIAEQPTQQFYNKTFGKYDALVEDGSNTTSQRQQQFAEMMVMKTQAGINFTDVQMIEASTIQNKQDIIEYMENVAKQESEAQQQETQITQQLQQAEAALAQAKAQLDQARAVESMSKIEDNKTQAITNLAEAHKDDEQASLNKSKALKELEEMDLSILERTINLLNIVKTSEQTGPTPVSQVSQGVK